MELPDGWHSGGSTIRQVAPARFRSRRIWPREFLSLPMFPELTEEQIEYVADCVSEAVGVATFALKNRF
jgi:hypothetical protein